MKAVKLFFISSVLLLIVALGAIAQNKYVPKADEEIYGTWTNKQYSAIYRQPERTVITTDGFKDYATTTDSLPYQEGKSQIDSKWTDSEGNIWYRVIATLTSGPYKGSTFLELSKLSQSATVWEHEWAVFVGEYDPTLYPKELDPNAQRYGIHYRTKE